MWGVALVAASGYPASGNDDWHFDSDQRGSSKICSMVHEAGGHILLVVHMRFAEKPDGGIISFDFKDEGLIEAAKAQHPVTLAFDTGTVEGYRLDYDPRNRFISITMTTYALSDLFAKFEKARHLEVVTASARVSFDLDGFAGALAALRSCAQPA